MASVLNDLELAKLLQIDPPLLARLIQETDVPRVMIADQMRFITQDVLSWLSAQEALLVPDAVGEPVKASGEGDEQAADRAETVVLPAQDDETPFVTREALMSLGHHAADPTRNLLRQQVRDGLAALGDAIHPTLVRLSSDRLHPSPSEADRTSPWRLDDQMECIDHVSMAWAEGAGLPGFVDRARVVLSVTADAIEFSVRIPADPADGPPNPAELKRARASGAMIAVAPGNDPWSVTYLYEVARGAPTAARLVAQLARDARTIVPLWLNAAAGGAKA
jgi:hypothetical protein